MRESYYDLRGRVEKQRDVKNMRDMRLRRVELDIKKFSRREKSKTKKDPEVLAL